MIERPKDLKPINARWEWWYVPDGKGIKKVFVDNKLGKEITEQEYKIRTGKINKYTFTSTVGV